MGDGMPKPNPRALRSKAIHIRCSDAELADWRRKAGPYSLSEFLRRQLDNAPATKRRSVPEVDSRLLAAVARAGNNLNQIARAMNADRRQRHGITAIAVLAELVVIDRTLHGLLKAHIR